MLHESNMETETLYCRKHPDEKLVRHNSRHTTKGWRWSCRKCARERERVWLDSPDNRTKERERWKANDATPTRRESKREGYILRSYGMSASAKEEMWLSQNKSCALCETPINLWALGRNDRSGAMIDHDHVTGEIRGLLCDNCNKGLGHFFDNTGKMVAAIQYLGGNPCQSEE